MSNFMETGQAWREIESVLLLLPFGLVLLLHALCERARERARGRRAVFVLTRGMLCRVLFQLDFTFEKSKRGPESLSLDQRKDSSAKDNRSILLFRTSHLLWGALPIANVTHYLHTHANTHR